MVTARAERIYAFFEATIESLVLKILGLVVQGVANVNYVILFIVSIAELS